MNQAVFKIDKGLPLPNSTGGRAGGGKYPFLNMSIGDSFGIPGDSRLAASIRSYASHMRTRHNLKFTVRKVDGGYRCWRIA